MQNFHQQLKDLLARGDTDAAQTLWLELADRPDSQPEFLLLLVNEFAVAGHALMAAELAGLLAPNLKAAGKLHEWLFAIKLQAAAMPNDKRARAELVEAYGKICEGDARWRPVLAASGLDDAGAALPQAVRRVDTLLALREGAFCRAKSWGFGRVKKFDAALGRLVVEFAHNPEHAIQLAYAADNLSPVSPEHLEARKATDLAGLQRLAADDPVALMRVVLHSHGRAATAAQIEHALAGSVIPTDQWKRWWENARKLLKKDGHFELPARKTDPIRLRTAPVSQQDELLAAFQSALDITQKTAATRQLLKILDQIEQPDLIMQEFYDGLLDALKKTKPNRAVDRLEAAFLLEDLLAQQRAPAETAAGLIDSLLAGISDLPALLEGLSAASGKRAVAALKRSQPDRLTKHINELPARALDDCGELLACAGDRIIQLVRNQTASYDLLHWVARAVTGPAAPAWLEPLPPHNVLAAILNALDLAESRGATKKLRDLLTEHETLLPDLLAQASPDAIRDLSRQLLASSGLDELDRRSLMARIVKEYPFVQDLLVTRAAKQQPLLVSRASYERRKTELEEIIQKKIPQLAKEIAAARSYGDLRENFEYKAAKGAQRLAMRRRAELELLLARATPTDFSDAKTESVQIGTSVIVTDLATGQQHALHILGAWDGNPDRNILSYPAALAQALLNKKPGDIVEAAGETGLLRYRIERIESTPAEILQSL